MMSSKSFPNTQSEPIRYLGLDVGGTKIDAGVVKGTGEVIAVNTVESHIGGSRDQVLADIYTALEPLRGQPLAGLGGGFPSFGDYDRGVLDSKLSGYPSMHGFPLRQHLEDVYGLPTKIVPDANLFAHGILRFGEGRRLSNFMAIGLGTGTAIGLVRDGQVLTGPKGFPEPTMRFYTEWGWPAAWGHSGYHFQSHYGADPETTYQRALAGDKLAICAFEQVGAALGDTITRLAQETQIRVAVIGGGLAQAWVFIEPTLRARVEQLAISVMKTELAYPSLVGAVDLFSV